MKLSFKYINEETGEDLRLKNDGDVVMYHSSRIHDHKEFDRLTGIVPRLTDDEKRVANIFYQLAGELL